MRRWRDLDEADRLSFTTVQSLYFFAWFFAVMTTSFVAERWDDDPGSVLLVAGANAVLAAASTVVVRDLVRRPRRRLPLGGTLLMAAAYAATFAIALTMPDDLRPGVLMGAVIQTCWALGAVRDTTANALVALATAVPVAVVADERFAAAYALGVALFMIFTVRFSLWLVIVLSELKAARATQAALAVAEERLRFSRDVHDVLGRRLSTIAVQADLAAALADRGHPGAAARMREVHDTAHEALREARELARGYRPADLHQELDGAGALLRSAGIAVDVHLDAPGEEWTEPAAWVVREAVTNVLRHSSAGEVSIDVRPDGLTITNDGVTGTGATAAGSGLDALRARLAPLGATLRTETDGERFTLTVALPARAADHAQAEALT